MTSPKPATAPDGIERLRRSKKALASFDAALAVTSAFRVQAVQVSAPPDRLGNLPPDAAAAVGQALRRLLEQQMDVMLAGARDLLLAEIVAAKRAAKDEYDRELAAIH